MALTPEEEIELLELEKEKRRRQGKKPVDSAALANQKAEGEALAAKASDGSLPFGGAVWGDRALSDTDLFNIVSEGAKNAVAAPLGGQSNVAGSIQAAGESLTKGNFDPLGALGGSWLGSAATGLAASNPVLAPLIAGPAIGKAWELANPDAFSRGFDAEETRRNKATEGVEDLTFLAELGTGAAMSPLGMPKRIPNPKSIPLPSVPAESPILDLASKYLPGKAGLVAKAAKGIKGFFGKSTPSTNTPITPRKTSIKPEQVSAYGENPVTNDMLVDVPPPPKPLQVTDDMVEGEIGFPETDNMFPDSSFGNVPGQKDFNAPNEILWEQRNPIVDKADALMAELKARNPNVGTGTPSNQGARDTRGPISPESFLPQRSRPSSTAETKRMTDSTSLQRKTPSNKPASTLQLPAGPDIKQLPPKTGAVGVTGQMGPEFDAWLANPFNVSKSKAGVNANIKGTPATVGRENVTTDELWLQQMIDEGRADEAITYLDKYLGEDVVNQLLSKLEI